MIPECPDEQSAKAVLMSLPTPPMIPVLRAGVPNANGRVYPPELVQKAWIDMEQKIANRTMLVYMPHTHGTPLELEDVCGVVERAEFDGTHLSVAVKFVHEKMAAIADALCFSVTGHGHLEGDTITDYIVDGVIASCTPARVA